METILLLLTTDNLKQQRIQRFEIILKYNTAIITFDNKQITNIIIDNNHIEINISKEIFSIFKYGDLYQNEFKKLLTSILIPKPYLRKIINYFHKEYVFINMDNKHKQGDSINVSKTHINTDVINETSKDISMNNHQECKQYNSTNVSKNDININEIPDDISINKPEDCKQYDSTNVSETENNDSINEAPDDININNQESFSINNPETHMTMNNDINEPTKDINQCDSSNESRETKNNCYNKPEKMQNNINSNTTYINLVIDSTDQDKNSSIKEMILGIYTHNYYLLANKSTQNDE